MSKILGLDIGTNSTGWAITEQQYNTYKLLYRGVNIFQEGVARNKSEEEPMVKTRTNARSHRRHYFRHRLQKIELLKVLISYNLCPQLSKEELDNWRYKKLFPLNKEFIQWLHSSNNNNPYADRYKSLTYPLDLTKQKDKYTLGRAIYHLAQRRGFLSNKKSVQDNNDSVVIDAINELDKAISNAKCNYLGEFYYQLFLEGKKIRTGNGYGHKDRNKHCKKEFDAICDKQQLPEDLRESLQRAIFFQRPLKSQKDLIGKCVFEKKKTRCPISHPHFEEFRMLSFINNIKIKSQNDNQLRVLTAKEKQLIEPLFYRKSKEHFNFEDIAKKLSGGKKGNYAYYTDDSKANYLFNFRMHTTVSGSPMITALRDIFGDNWQSTICSLYLKSDKKSETQILNDIWHILFSFDNDEKLFEWAKINLQLSDEEAKKFSNIKIRQGYAALSLNAIDKILPYLRAGYRYDEAVFIANMPKVASKEIWQDDVQRHEIIQDLCTLLDEFKTDPQYRHLTKKQAIDDMLLDKYDIDYNKSSKLYEPSRIEPYPKAQLNKNGLILLGSPRTSSVRNPMAMRALFRLRALVNQLLIDGKIDKTTKINIEFSRELNDSNMRKAIYRYQMENYRIRDNYASEIIKLYKEKYNKNIIPTEDDILKYKLWVEQKGICLYTQEKIDIWDFISPNPIYDIEHTIPLSRGGDDSQMNKTLCKGDYNKYIKCQKIPSELNNHSKILELIEEIGWQKEIEKIEKGISVCNRTVKNAITKEAKDKAIQNRHYLRMKLDYLKGKLMRFTINEIPEGFKNRQGNDIGIIGKYAKMYLETVFDKVYTVKGSTTADFRKIWGLQDEYNKKERTNHAHHCIDAIVISCIDKGTYDRWAQFKQDTDRYKFYNDKAPVFDKPWPTFTEDVMNISDSLLVSHHTNNNLPKHTRKKLRVQGKIQYNSENKPKYKQGDTARASLHLDTFYGAIKQNGEIKYVIRKALSELRTTDIKNIIDDSVRKCVEEAINKLGFKEALSKPICFNKAKGVYIKKVRIEATKVKSPIQLKKHRMLSRFDYKQHYFVKNENNYCIGIYEGRNAKGNLEKSYQIVNILEACKFYNNKSNSNSLLPKTDINNHPLRYILRNGTMVLFYEKDAAELYKCSTKELTKRLYKVTGLNKDGRIGFTFHQEAREDKIITEECGKGISNVNVHKAVARLRLSPNNLRILVEGYDFELTVTGEIKFNH